jgi:hypothetical protein
MGEPYINRLRECIAACRDQFLSYVQHHRTKGADDKAATNEAFAQRCAAVLAEGDAEYAPGQPPDTDELALTPRQIELLFWQIINDFAGGEVSTIPPTDAPDRRVAFYRDGEYVKMMAMGIDDA